MNHCAAWGASSTTHVSSRSLSSFLRSRFLTARVAHPRRIDEQASRAGEVRERRAARAPFCVFVFVLRFPGSPLARPTPTLTPAPHTPLVTSWLAWSLNRSPSFYLSLSYTRYTRRSRVIGGGCRGAAHFTGPATYTGQITTPLHPHCSDSIESRGFLLILTPGLLPHQAGRESTFGGKSARASTRIHPIPPQPTRTRPNHTRPRTAPCPTRACVTYGTRTVPHE